MGGGDKTLLPIGGRPMLAWVIAALGVNDIAISANGDRARFGAFNRPVLPDGPFPGQGPLAGLLAGLDWAAGGGADRGPGAPRRCQQRAQASFGRDLAGRLPRHVASETIHARRPKR